MSFFDSLQHQSGRNSISYDFFPSKTLSQSITIFFKNIPLHLPKVWKSQKKLVLGLIPFTNPVLHCWNETQ